MEKTLPIIALALSVASLSISILGYLRDRAKVRAWAEIIWHRRGPNPDSETPGLLIRIANLGRRPAVLLNLRMKNRNGYWSRHLKPPMSTDPNPLSVEETFRLIDNHVLAQNSAVKLAEGEAMDLTFWPDDSFCFMDTHSDSPSTANALYIQDCTGKCIRVKNDSRLLNQLLAHRSEVADKELEAGAREAAYANHS